MWNRRCHRNEKKKGTFETMKKEGGSRRNDRRGKVKAAVSFHPGRGGDRGRIRCEGKKDLLTSWDSITSLPVSAGPPLSHDRRAGRKCVGLRQRHTRAVWRQLSVDGSLSHTPELPLILPFSSKAVNKQGGKLWLPNWNYRKMTKQYWEKLSVLYFILSPLNRSIIVVLFTCLRCM